MIGVPPTVGFVSKVYIILASLDAAGEHPQYIIFVAVMLFSTLLNLVYFWRVIETNNVYEARRGRRRQHAGKR